jgi:hypothetical protein
MINKTNFIRDIFNPKKDKFTLLYKLKQSSTFESTLSILNEAIKHPYVKALVFSYPFPRNYDELRKQKYLQTSGNLNSEIAWILFPIIKHSEKINSFLNNKLQFETAFLLGDYDKAEDILKNVEQEFGYSLWLIENRLLFAETKSGTEANWLELSEIANQMSDGLLLYLTENISKKIEDKISFSRFKDILVNQIDDLTLPNNFREYLLFRLNYIGVKKFYNYDFFLATESTSSLIDRYLILRDIIVEIIDTEYDFNFSSFLSKTSVINDKLLIQISNYLQLTDFKIIEGTDECLKYFDIYTKGEYEILLNTLKDEIAKHPAVIELYDLYVKTTIEVSSHFIPTNTSTYIDKILYNLYLIYSKSLDANTGVEELYKIVTTNFSSDWSKQLYSIINSAATFEKEDTTIEKFYLFYSKINNPKSINDVDSAKSNFNLPFLINKYYNNISLQILNSISAGDYEHINKIDDLPIRKKQLYLSKAYYNARLFKSVIQLAEELLTYNISSYIREEALVLLYKSYLHLEDVTKALLIFVNTYTANNNLIKRFNTQSLLNAIQSHLHLVSNLIEYPIFYSIAYNDPYEVYVAYDNYLSSSNLEKPSELIGSDINNDKLVLFFREVCKFDVLKHSYNFISKEDIENERSLLLDELLKLDKRNESLYIKEITTLSQNAAVKKAIREVDKAKITINVEQLKDAESNSIKEGFNRYIELANFSKNRNVQGIDITSKQLSDYYKNINNELRNKVVYTNDPAFISFKVMFLDIRDKFILSKEYGLDGYLSTRIRHGTFQNYIRSVFETENLISQKDSNGEYLDINYWKQNIPYYLTSKSEEVQNAIHQFSKKIDDYTEFIIKELIQVKTEKHDNKQNALFDYSLTQHQLAAAFKVTRDSIKDHKAFINLIFEYLTALTEDILENVKKAFVGNITETYTQIVTEFHDEVKRIITGHSFPNLTSAIMKCNTLIRRELINISQWFNISNPTSDLLLDINTIIQTSIQITNRIYPYKKINPDIITPRDINLKGSINFIYITRILLDNILQHSYVDTNNLKVIIEIALTSDGYLKLTFSNNLSNKLDLLEIDKKLSEIKDKWDNEEQDFNKTDIEGGSGFDKIRRIIMFDMRNKQHRFEYSIKGDMLSISLFLKVKTNE